MTWVGSAPRNERYEVALTALARTILEADAAVDGVMISPTTVYVVKGSNTTRYLLSGDARAALARHVEGTGDFEPGRPRPCSSASGEVRHDRQYTRSRWTEEDSDDATTTGFGDRHAVPAR